MKFKKGQGGRPKGAKNKATKNLKKKIDKLLCDNWEQINKDLMALSPKDRVNTFVKLLEYSVPKLNRAEVQNKDNVTIDFREQPLFNIDPLDMTKK